MKRSLLLSQKGVKNLQVHQSSSISINHLECVLGSLTARLRLASLVAISHCGVHDPNGTGPA